MPRSSLIRPRTKHDRRHLCRILLAFSLAACSLVGAAVFADEPFRSHPPARPLPVAANWPLEGGPTWFVDPADGDDSDDGSFEHPWRTAQHGVEKLRPGDTLCLRGGVYYEHVAIDCRGTPDRPITIRGYPGELAVIDGGLREFHDNPAGAWEPCPDGAPGEYRSKRALPGLGEAVDGVNVRGHFADSMIPLQGYRYLKDLRDDSMAWDIENKVAEEEGVYCGPGIFFDVVSGRLHCRLAHTDLAALGDDNYRGDTDPRRMSLCISAARDGAVLRINGATDVQFQDLVVRGSATAAIDVADSARLTFDGLTVYGGHTCFDIRDSVGMRLWDTACRGVAAPWTFRGHLKYRSTEARLFSTGDWTPSGAELADFELAWCEFTDSVDGVFVGNVRGVHFHHNLVDNISDDALFLTAGTGYDGLTPGGDVLIERNLLSRCLTTFAFGVGHGRQRMTDQGPQTGNGAFITRNVFDFRRPVMYLLPADTNATAELTSKGRFACDHGSPCWEPMTVYHNTLLADDPSPVGYGTFGLGDHVAPGGARRLFNNIICQLHTLPGQTLPEIVLPAAVDEAEQTAVAADSLDALLDQPDEPDADAAIEPELRQVASNRARRANPATDFQADGNLHWSLEAGPTFEGEFLAGFRRSDAFEQSKRVYPPGWTASDQFADPRFRELSTDWRDEMDLELSPGSPAVDAGVAPPDEWPDPIRDQDKGRPDVGAIPSQTSPWRVAVGGRLTVFGAAEEDVDFEQGSPAPFTAKSLNWSPPDSDRSVAMVEGYPEFDAPLLDFAFRKAGAAVDRLPLGQWLAPTDYKQHRVVVIAGDLQRAGTKPDHYAPNELPIVRDYLEKGGTLIVVRRGKRVFDLTPEGRALLAELLGNPRESDADRASDEDATDRRSIAIRLPDHPWVAHLLEDEPHPWLAPPIDGDITPWRAARGERILASADGVCLLHRLPVGRGQLIYIGWQVSAALPHGRLPGSDEQESLFDEQMRILLELGRMTAVPFDQ